MNHFNLCCEGPRYNRRVAIKGAAGYLTFTCKVAVKDFKVVHGACMRVCMNAQFGEYSVKCHL